MLEHDLLRRSRWMGIAAAGLALVVAGLALAGGRLGEPRLASWVMGQVTMKTNAAIGIALGAGACLLLGSGRRTLSWRGPAAGLALLVLLLASTTLVQDALHFDLGIDQALAAESPGAPGTAAPNRMSPVSALGLMLFAAAAMLQATERERLLLAAQAVSFGLLALVLTVLTGYVYGIEPLREVPPFTAISLPTTVALLALTLSLLLARPEIGPMRLVVDPTAGGSSVRRLLPAVVILLFVAGAARVWGERRGYFTEATGTALIFVTASMVIGTLVVRHAIRLREAELRLRREQEIQAERQQQFRRAIVAAPIPILMFAEDGEILQVSRTVEELTGHREEELADLASWHELTRAGEGGDDELRDIEGSREISVRTHDGSVRIWRLSTSSLGTMNDDRRVFVTMGADITELREADRRKDEFLAVLGHELRNPLAAISSGIELLGRTETARRRKPEIREMMARQVRHLSRLIDDLLDVSRISRGKIELRFETVSLGEALERALDDHRDALTRHGHRLSVSMPPSPVHVRADPTRLHQMLVNLISNAVKYTDEGGRIWVSLERDDVQAVVRVRDTGVGMTPDMVEAAFQPFRQFHRDGGRGQGGLGLGLTLVRELAEMHGGAVSAASRGPGSGATFVLRLPVAAELAPPSPATRPVAAPDGSFEVTPLRVVVVDDQQDVADSFAELLEMSGFPARAAYTGAGALAEVAASVPQVVFLDLDLPDLDGYALATRIRAECDPPPVLVAVSGFGGEGHRRRSAEVGIAHHLVKPVDLPAVLDLLREIATRAA